MGRRTWVKIWVNMLRSTTFEELAPDERFVWFGFLLLAGDSPIEGKITITENVGFTDEQLCDLLKCSLELIQRAKNKLIEVNKISVHQNNVIEIVNWKKYQSEYQRQKQYRKLQDKVTTESYNSKLQPEVTVKSYAVEGEEEGEEEGEIEIEDNKKEDIVKKEYRERVRKMVEEWNTFAEKHNLAKIRGVPPGSKREKMIKARLKEEEFVFSNILEKAGKSDFLLGAKGWKVSFDWLICPSNYIKVLEGNYDNRGQKSDLQRKIEDLDKKFLKR